MPLVLIIFVKMISFLVYDKVVEASVSTNCEHNMNWFSGVLVGYITKSEYLAPTSW
jgi:hypothetical protein